MAQALVDYISEEGLPTATQLCLCPGQRRGPRDLELRWLPWRQLCDHVLRQGSRHGALALATTEALRAYLVDWSESSAWVRDTLEWKYTPTEMNDISRMGAWLGDVVHTELCVRAGTHNAWAQFVVVHNKCYKRLGMELLCETDVNSSPNNVGNIFEHLHWLAFEEKKENVEEQRCEWILAVLRWLRDGRMSSRGAPQPAASASGGAAASSSRGPPQPAARARVADAEARTRAGADQEEAQARARVADAEARARYYEGKRLASRREQQGAEPATFTSEEAKALWAWDTGKLTRDLDMAMAPQAEDPLQLQIGVNTGAGSSKINPAYQRPHYTKFHRRLTQ